MLSIKEDCQFGETCYRLQESHFTSFNHPHLDSLLDQITSEDIEIPASYKPKISVDTLHSQLNILKWLRVSQKQSASSSTRSESNLNNSGDVDRSAKMDSTATKRKLNDYMNYIRKRCKGNVVEKLKHSEPYRFFLSSIAAESKTHDEMLSMSFSELLSPELGVLESSLQINFMVQISWLLAQYAVNCDKSTPITLLHGSEDAELTHSLQNNLIPNVTAKYLKPSAFGSHHTKMMILSYEDKSIRVIITTGNLIEFDWENTTQGLWISPKLPRIESDSDAESEYDSETNFKKDLLHYLRNYNLSVVEPWIEKVKNADFREVKVFFIASVPGTHARKSTPNWGLNRLSELLSDRAVVPSEEAKSWSLCYQCSSIGSLGKDPYAWLLAEVTRAMSSSATCNTFQPPVKVIYPCFEDIASSYDGLAAGGCLPYGKNVHDKQTWFNQYLCKWRSQNRNRNRAMPHIKTYCRFSPCKKFASWFLLTSANLSKAAWGMENKAKTDLRILNYEVGVLFIPSILIGKDKLPLNADNPLDNGPSFPVPYDLPLVPYSSQDVPWFIDMLS